MPKGRKGWAKRGTASRNRLPEAAPITTSINTSAAGPSTAEDGSGIDLSGDAAQPLLVVETQTVTDPAPDNRGMDKTDKELSKRLHEELDVIGASEYTRKKYWESAMFNNIPIRFLSNLYPNPVSKISTYQVGSRCEGTTTTGLESDLDVIICYEDFPVVDSLESERQGFSFLIVTDENNKPGYVYLQHVEDRCPHTNETWYISDSGRFEFDRKGRVCAKHVMCNLRPNTFRHGPAETMPARNGICPMDLVYAYRCRDIPRSVNSWMHRTRKYGWPSDTQLNVMGSYGCFLVGVGHPQSAQKSIEWKFSFSLQERDLMLSLNETQHKCYILLKMIKKDIIESKVGKSISSYHCKRSLFYTIENSHRHIWKYGNLILCVRRCLVRLLIWVKERNCPNYFIPDDNLFDKLSPMTLTNTEYILNAIIDSGVNFLYSITCDNVGEFLKQKSKMRCSKLVCSQAISSTILEPQLPSLYINIAASVYGFRNNILERINVSCTINKGYLNMINEALLCLQKTDHVTEHTTRDVRMVLDSLIPHILLQYQQCIFANILSLGNMSRLLSKSIQNVLPETSDCDLISSKLSLASLYIQSEQRQEECERILASCEKDLKPHIISVCYCYEHGLDTTPGLAELRFTDMSSKDFIRHCTTGCMVFHSSQVSLVHAALHYELFRTVYTHPGQGFIQDNDYWLNWITVDSQIYLYFIQYLHFYKTEKLTEKATARLKLVLVLASDHDSKHKETGYNLLGWIYLQENELQNAWKSFCKSWIIRSFKNAAKWHMLILLREMIKEN